MKREVFILPNGEAVFASHIEFAEMVERRETAPCTIHESNGSVRRGSMSYSVEFAVVTFCASPGTLRLGQSGQLSGSDDLFYQVTISSIEPAEEYVRVVGQAERKFDYKKDS